MLDLPQDGTMDPLIILVPLVASRKQTLQIFASLSLCAHSIVTIRSTNGQASVIYIILLGRGGGCQLQDLKLAGWGEDTTLTYTSTMKTISWTI